MAGEPYVKAMLVESPRIAGMRIKPLSCWHILCLIALDNPIAVGGEPSPSDIAIALLICSSEWRNDTNAALRSIARFHANRLLALTMGIRLLFCRDAEAKLKAHIECYCDHPDYLPTKDGKPSAVFFPFRTATALINMGYSQEEAWNMPYLRALCYIAVDDENNGAKIISRDTIDAAHEAISKLEEGAE